MLLKISTIALVGTALISCGPFAGEVDEVGAVANFNDVISEASASRIIEEINKNDVRLLRFSSPGGSESWAFKIVDAIAENEVDLEIYATCLSACAQIVMLAPTNVKLSENSILGFHHSSYALHHWSTALVDSNPELEALQAASQSLSRKYEARTSMAGLDYLIYSFYAIGPECLKWPEADNSNEFTVNFKRSYVFPLDSDLVAIGIEPPKNWPGTRQEARERVSSMGWDQELFAFKPINNRLEGKMLGRCMP